ncbi:hypothetical protein B0H13DRAFT_1905506 [Mycena leptocephala]|nr:hypothetical protein B0H13DRAFT_1905506 [Mycena leptocephala]
MRRPRSSPGFGSYAGGAGKKSRILTDTKAKIKRWFSRSGRVLWDIRQPILHVSGPNAPPGGRGPPKRRPLHFTYVTRLQRRRSGPLRGTILRRAMKPAHSAACKVAREMLAAEPEERRRSRLAQLEEEIQAEIDGIFDMVSWNAGSVDGKDWAQWTSVYGKALQLYATSFRPCISNRRRHRPQPPRPDPSVLLGENMVRMSEPPPPPKRHRNEAAPTEVMKPTPYSAATTRDCDGHHTRLHHDHDPTTSSPTALVSAIAPASTSTSTTIASWQPSHPKRRSGAQHDRAAERGNIGDAARGARGLRAASQAYVELRPAKENNIARNRAWTRDLGLMNASAFFGMKKKRDADDDGGGRGRKRRVERKMNGIATTATRMRVMRKATGDSGVEKRRAQGAAWVTKAKSALDDVGETEMGSGWTAVKDLWLRLEESSGFSSKTKPHPTTFRPKAVGVWVKNARKGTPEFVVKAMEQSVAPARRESGEGGRWMLGCVEVSRSKGFLNIIICLKWWRTHMDMASDAWERAIVDVKWVLERMVGPEKGAGPGPTTAVIPDGTRPPLPPLPLPSRRPCRHQAQTQSTRAASNQGRQALALADTPMNAPATAEPTLEAQQQPERAPAEPAQKTPPTEPAPAGGAAEEASAVADPLTASPEEPLAAAMRAGTSGPEPPANAPTNGPVAPADAPPATPVAPTTPTTSADRAGDQDAEVELMDVGPG